MAKVLQPEEAEIPKEWELSEDNVTDETAEEASSVRNKDSGLAMARALEQVAYVASTHDAATAMALSDSGVQRVDKRRRESMAAHCQAMKEARSCRRDVRRFTRSSTMVERAILYQTGILMGQAGKDALESFPLSISLQIGQDVYTTVAPSVRARHWRRCFPSPCAYIPLDIHSDYHRLLHRFVDLKSEAHESILENILEKVDCGLQGLDVRPGGEGGVRGAATLNEHERQSASPGLDEARSASAGDDAANRVSRRSCDRSDRGLQDRGAPEQQEADLGGECGRCESATGLGSGQGAPLSTSAPPGGSTDDQARHRGDARKEVGDAESSDDATPANGRPWSPPLSEGAEVAPQELSEQARPRGAPPTLARDRAEPPDWQLGDGSRIRPITMRDQDLVALADPLATRASSGASSDGSVSDDDGEIDCEREAEAGDLDSCLEVGVTGWKEEEGGDVSAATQPPRSGGRATSPEAGHCAELSVSSTSHHEGSRRGSPMWRRSELILRDVGRTFPRLARFRSLETRMQMWRVLMAYSLFDPEVGYCQGMGFVVGMLLMYLSEQDAFRSLVKLMVVGELRVLYLPGLHPLQMLLSELEEQVLLRLPRLGAHLQHFDVPSMAYAPTWLLSCFGSAFPSLFAARVMDLMMAVHKPINVLIQVSLAVLDCAEPELLRRHEMDQLLLYIKEEVPRWSEERLEQVMKLAVHVRIEGKLKTTAKRFNHADLGRQQELLNATVGRDEALEVPRKSRWRLSRFLFPLKRSEALGAARDASTARDDGELVVRIGTVQGDVPPNESVEEFKDATAQAHVTKLMTPK
eukprot:CAMPEP_0114261148 /NCGR_PEP_ID=MMETSP0058-20121206/20946_1 /TAXON_ID=36894 /ORGANISM="Pyramimonas parkeae, CCMP726" /LENGTH=810 /DNA_ID=CAMNT_0001376591 /DNA_START=205 /DNA_END=2639 /DNA_ORIENTATION=+